MQESKALSTGQSYSIAELGALVRSGGIRVPQFQRSFRWSVKDVLSLFDSVLRGYPIGSLLLWQRQAPQDDLRIGALHVKAGARPDALWVVDGQQRVTSLVNVVSPEGAKDPRFALGYSIPTGEVVSGRALGEPLTIPLPDLFSFSRALAWLSANPDAAEHAEHIQDMAGRLNQVRVPATVMTQADEGTLKEVFNRINNRGKRLSLPEIFDAIHGRPQDRLTTSWVAARVDAQTRFGLLDDKIVAQALLVRRHTNISRDIHREFTSSQREVCDFPGESEQEAYEATERALVSAARFLQERCSIPHLTFLPFRFQLLVLARFFAFFPEPADRNVELLSRWVWRTSVGADSLGLTGSAWDLRQMAKHVRQGEQSGSVQRLLQASRLTQAPPLPDLSTFRATKADSKIILTALWSLKPVDLATGEPITPETLVEQLEGETSPRAVVTDLVAPTALPDGSPVAANKVVSVLDRQDLVARLDASQDLSCLLLDQEMLEALQSNRHDRLLALRETALRAHLREFIAVRTAYDQEDSGPLEAFVFDEREDLG